MSIGADCSQSYRLCYVSLGATQDDRLSDRSNYLSSQKQFILPILTTPIKIAHYSDGTCVSPVLEKSNVVVGPIAESVEHSNQPSKTSY